MTVEDLVQRLLPAAEAAIKREAGSLAYDVHRIRSVTLELSVESNGKVVQGSCYVERKPATYGKAERT